MLGPNKYYCILRGKINIRCEFNLEIRVNGIVIKRSNFTCLLAAKFIDNENINMCTFNIRVYLYKYTQENATYFVEIKLLVKSDFTF